MKLFWNQRTLLHSKFSTRTCKSIIDQTDEVLAKHYGFDEMEPDFTITYDIKYRMGRVEDDGD